MRVFTLSALSTVSFGALAFGLVSPAAAQTQPQQPVTPSEVQACAELPTPAQQQACIAAQAQDDDTVQESGELATIPPEEAAELQAEGGDTIVVTGSRIRRNPFTSPDPITVIDPDAEERGGEIGTAEILQSNPIAAGSVQIGSVLSAGSFVTNGGAGAQTLSLRGLGAERTLVLVNGRRAGPAGTRGAIAGFDLNVMPSSLIETVDILKTGASSIYGSDAIAGVVNILTRRTTDGIDLRGFASVPFESGGETYNLSAAYGKDFGRGHFLVGADYYRRNDLSRGDRDYLECSEERTFDRAGQTRMDLRDPRTGEPYCTDFIQNNVFLINVGLGFPPGTRSTIVQPNNPGDNLDPFAPPATNVAPPGFNFVGIANPNDPFFISSQGVVDRWDPMVLDADVFPDLERHTFWADGSFEITPNIEVIGEFLYNNRKTSSDRFRQLFFFQFPGTMNPLLSTALCGALAPEGANCVPGDTGDPLNQGWTGNHLLQPVVPIFTYNKTDVDYYRAVGGLRGGFGGGGFLEELSWDSYVQYSRSDGDYTDHRILEDAVAPQEVRTRLCEGTVTHIRGVPCMDIDFTDPRILAGQFTQAERDFLFDEETGNTIFEQLTAEASVAGRLFSLPAGDVGVAVGGQWRRDEIDDQPGPITQAGNVWGQSTAERTAGFTRTTEVFGEVEVPLIHNTPLVQMLTFSGAARLTNVYMERNDGESDTSKNNWTYKLGLNWQANDWLRFRGTYGTSYRAPALFELFLASQTGFFGQANIDPCVNWGINLAAGSLPQRVADRCAALGIPANYGGAGSSALYISSGGLGNLEPETSTAKTVSVILTPDVGLWEGNRFSVAVDYFDIEVEGEITQLGPNPIIFGCLNSEAYPNDPLCAQFTRETDPNSPRFPNILEINDPYINIASQRNRGVDVTARMTQDLARFGNLSALAQMTWQIQDTILLFPSSPITDNEGESGEPTWVGDFKFTWDDNGPWSVFYNLNVVGGTTDEQDLRDARGGDVCITSSLRPPEFCPIYRLEPTFYHSASLTREVGERFRITLGVNNIFDTEPPRVSGAFGPITNIGNAPWIASQYDFIGRRAFISVRTKL